MQKVNKRFEQSPHQRKFICGKYAYEKMSNIVCIGPIFENTKCWQRCGAIGALTLRVECKMQQPLWKMFASFLQSQT